MLALISGVRWGTGFIGLQTAAPLHISLPADLSFGLTNVGRRLAGMCQNVKQASWFLFAPKPMIRPIHLLS